MCENREGQEISSVTRLLVPMSGVYEVGGGWAAEFEWRQEIVVKMEGKTLQSGKIFQKTYVSCQKLKFF